MARTIPLDKLTIYSKRNIPSVDTDFESGCAFLLDKPYGISSFKVVKKLRKALDLSKIGHAGTLDPMATGLLILCVGKGTKSVKFVQELHKQYTGEVTLGARTPSYDAETEIEETAEWKHITLEMIDKVMQEQFSGTFVQYPPVYSAIRKNGERLYKKARRGEKVDIPPRQVSVYDYQVYDKEGPKFQMDVTCSRGTYIRSLAFDIGKALDSLAYLSALRRTAIGDFLVEDAFTVEDIEQHFL
jgi:tRNA pseudouridine55 synthase